MQINYLIDKLSHDLPNVKFLHLNKVNGTYTVEVWLLEPDTDTARFRFLVTWAPEDAISVQLIKTPVVEDTLGMKSTSSPAQWFETADAAALFIVNYVANTPTKVGIGAKIWLAVRPYVIWLIPKFVRRS